MKKEKIAGLPATAVEVKGTYMGGSVMVPSAPKPGDRLLGAIVEGPGGNVYFKLTGSEMTVAGAEKPFRKLLDGLNKKQEFARARAAAGNQSHAPAQQE